MEEKFETRNEVRRHRHGIFWPLMFIAVGGILLLVNLRIIDGSVTWGWITRLWPLILIVGGLDELYRRGGIVGPIFWIGLGGYFLLNNLGYLPYGSWITLLRYWPVILIVAGLDVMIGRNRSLIGGLVGAFLGLVILAGILWLVMQTPINPASLKSETINQPLGGATSAKVNFMIPVGRLAVADGAEPSSLANGKLQLASTEKLERSFDLQGKQAVYNLKSSGVYYSLPPFGGTNPSGGWDLQLNNKIPLDVKSEVVVGEHNLNLGSLKVENGEVQTVIGQTRLVLPEECDFELSTSVIIGETIVEVPADCDLNIHLDTAITGISLPAGFIRDGDEVWSSTDAKNSADATLDLENIIGSVVVRMAK